MAADAPWDWWEAPTPPPPPKPATHQRSEAETWATITGLLSGLYLGELEPLTERRNAYLCRLIQGGAEVVRHKDGWRSVTKEDGQATWISPALWADLQEETRR